MFDVKAIRDAPADFDHGLARRGLGPLAAQVAALDAKRRGVIAALEKARAGHKALSRKIGARVAGGAGEDATAQSKALKVRIRTGQDEERALTQELDSLLSGLPNLPLPDVPDGADESAAAEHHRNGRKREFAFPPKRHEEIGLCRQAMDFAAAAQVSGARFVVLRGALARLERALGAFMLDLQVREFGYAEVSVPLLVRTQAMFGTAQLPKFAHEQFQTGDLWLVPTAEVPLTNLVREQILDESALPLRLAALSPCFRKEAGAAGRDTRGMLRQHQFNKVELVSVTAPGDAPAELERMLSCAEEALKRLELHYRVVVLAAQDMGFSARKTYDIEVWMPGQQAYREVSSCSLCGDFQARRMAARYRPAGGKGTRFVHTLNGSALAVGRTLIAVLEERQNEDGSVSVPPVLRPYMGGMDLLEPDD